MILTPIAPERLPATLAGFAASLDDVTARAVFAAIAATSPERAEGISSASRRRKVKRHSQAFLGSLSAFCSWYPPAI